jgi:flagellar M-ring protein FliF
MSPRGRIALGASVVGVIVVAFMLMKLASAPSYTTLSAGIDPSQTGKITGALDGAGVAYKIGNGGTSIQVKQGDVSAARVALAAKGLSSSGSSQPGFELLDKQKLGASSFQQQVAYQRALEGQIAGTIGQMTGVGGATVQLTMPQDQLFASESKPATAAVLLGSGAANVDPGQVKGIANLVASSVPNLKTQNVTITDSSGNMLWPSGDAANGGVSSKPAAEARYDGMMAAELNAIIQRTVGPGKASVQVQSDLNVDATQKDELAYAKKGIALEKSTQTEKLKGSGAAGASGASGAAANIPTYAAGAGGAGGNSNYQRKQDNTKFGVGKVVTHTKVAPGAVNRLDVALVVDPSVPAATRKQLQQAIGSAAGVTRARGDTITTSVVPFAKQAATTAAAGPVTNIIGYAKWVALGLASLIFLFFMRRALRKREEADLLGEPVWLNQIDMPRPIGELAAGGGLDGQPTHALPPAQTRRHVVEQVVEKEPERVVQALRTWMAEEEQ